MLARYRIAKKAGYDPAKIVPWDTIKVEKYTDEEIEAGRYFWSVTAWFEYMTMEVGVVGLDGAIKYGLSNDARAHIQSFVRDEWAHVELAATYAERLGGVLEPSEFVSRKYGEMLEAGSTSFASPKDAPHAIHILFLPISYSEFSYGGVLYGTQRDGGVSQAKDPIARQINTLFYTDEMRHSRNDLEWSLPAVKEMTKNERDLVKHIVQLHPLRLTTWYGYGYRELPDGEKKEHLRKMSIAKKVGWSAFDGEELVDMVYPSYQKNTKILHDVGIDAKFVEGNSDAG
jgi:hypothetical protein